MIHPDLGGRWFTLSFCTISALVLLASVWFAVKMERATRQRDVIVNLSGSIIYDHEGVDDSGSIRSRGNPPDHVWLRKMLGDDFFSVVIAAIVYCDADMVHVKECVQIRFLSFYSQRVTDAALKDLRPLTELQTMMFYGTQVTDQGLESLENLPQLRRLVLINTQVTDAGVAQLKKALPNCQIEWHGTGGDLK